MTSPLKTITGCEVCDGNALLPVLDLGEQPLCDDLVPIGNSSEPPKYPIRLLLCRECLTVHQQYQVNRTVLFPQSYHYRAAMTQDVLAGMRELVELTETITSGLNGKKVLDIGCNDGSLLSFFRERGAKTVGIEPTGAAEDARARVDHVINAYFDEKSVAQYLKEHPQPDVITFTNVFAHIDDLAAVLKNLRCLMRPGTLLIVENHYLGSVLARNQFDTFYHEHPRTYSFRSFQHIARKLGRKIMRVEFPPRYNGNIRVVIGDGAETTEVVDESSFNAQFPSLADYIDVAKRRTLATLHDLVSQHGKLVAKAFPGRASVIVGYYGLNENLITAAYERPGSPKIGNYVPGTRIEIRDENELFAGTMPPVIVNLAWHIRDEISRYMRQNGFTGQILDIFS